MNFVDLKELTIPEGEVVKIECGNIILWEKPPSFKNWMNYSINADGTIYNNGLGYKKDYRVRSGGAEQAQSSGGLKIVITGFIPFTKGDVLEIYPPFTGGNTDNTINFADSDFNNLGQVTDSGAYYGICNVTNMESIYKSKVVDGVSVLEYTDSFDSRVAYVRVGNNYYLRDMSEFIITVKSRDA